MVIGAEKELLPPHPNPLPHWGRGDKDEPHLRTINNLYNYRLTKTRPSSAFTENRKLKTIIWARIGIITCSNCTQESNCAAVVCLADMRKRRGFFEPYPKDKPLELIGIISCAGCPTIAAPEKILQRVRAVAAYRLDALHLSFCLVTLCPFAQKYSQLINLAFPDINLIMGTQQPTDRDRFRKGFKELLCQTLSPPQTMNDLIKGTIKLPGE